uniref:Uncharacterized protein n=1 Tax=Lotus japonicus TaxID=34305 RepID=I3T328_LOTJA|nr:unknown [Lotus japonicus]
MCRCSVTGTNKSSSPCQRWTEPSLVGNGFSRSKGLYSQLPNPIFMSRWRLSNSPCCFAYAT